MSWLTRLQEKIAKSGDTVPPGWWNTEDEAKRLKVSRCTLQKNMKLAFEAGILERKIFLVMRGKYLRKVPYYREVK